jgi:hypothetical protein
MIWKMANWTIAEDKGVVIQPFDTDGIGDGIDGKSVAQLLISELQRIQGINLQAKNISIPKGFQVCRVPNVWTLYTPARKLDSLLTI